MKTYLQCNCSSIRAKGERVETLPLSLANFRSKFNFRIPVYQIADNYPINAVPNFSVSRVSDGCYDIICNICRAKFRIFLHGRKSYLQFLILGKNPNTLPIARQKNGSTNNYRLKSNYCLSSRPRVKTDEKELLTAIEINDSCDLPIPLRPFIFLEPIVKQPVESDVAASNSIDDDDFELMFSKSKETLIGSFHNSSLDISDMSVQ